MAAKQSYGGRSRAPRRAGFAVRGAARTRVLRLFGASILILAAPLVSPRLALAQFTQQGQKLVGSGASGKANQGSSVALSAEGNTALVGALDDNSGAGAAWVFTRGNGVWSQQGPKLVGTGASGKEVLQGWSVALSGDGNTAILGGPYDNDFTGAAWVFTRANGVWSQLGQKLVGTDASKGAFQGWSVALSGDGNTAIVGGPFDNGGAGAAWVFTRGNGVWSQQGQKLVGTGASIEAAQGYSVALSADGATAILGGPLDNSRGRPFDTRDGAAWVFTRSNGVWAQQGKKLAGLEGEGDYQGYSVALSADGNTAILGAPYDKSTGGALVFTRANGVWRQLGPQLVGTGASGEGVTQGWSVALSGDGATAILGGLHDNENAGAAWVFARVCATADAALVNKQSPVSGTLTYGISSPSRILQSITLTASTNIASYTLPAVSGDGHSATGGVFIKANPNAPATFELAANFVSPAFACTIDPITATLRIETGHTAVLGFQTVPKAEHFLEISNGDPGLRWLQIHVNGRYRRSLSLSSGRTVNLDLFAAMNQDENTLTFTGEGRTGSFANINVSDGAPAPPARVPPSGDWEKKAAGVQAAASQGRLRFGF